MAFINYETRQILTKVVWYGPAASGKTASLQHIWERTRTEEARTVKVDPTADANTSYYEYLPVSLGEIRGYKTTFWLYTVPGAPGYAGARHALLEKVDGLIFAADSRPQRQQENVFYLAELRGHLASWGFALEKMPFVIQCTFTDAPGALAPAQVAAALLAGHPDAAAVPVIASVPPQGVGVFDAMKAVAKLVLTELKKG